MIVRLASFIQKNSIVDGEGLRAVVWAQGCKHNCPGCHNPETHDMLGGMVFDVEDIKKQLSELTYCDGVTFSGGDPMFQPEAFGELAKFVKSLGMNVWCYTGFEFEKLTKIAKKNKHVDEFLRNIDVLVDGKFKIEERSLNLYFRGSKNQRIIDVKKSLMLNQTCEIEKYKIEKPVSKYDRLANESCGVFC